MTPESMNALAQSTIYITMLVLAPILLIALVVGVLVSIIQAATQIQEQTLAFVPKIVAVLVGLLLFGPWMLMNLIDFTRNIFTNLTKFIG